jgi:peptide/nickel transport system substrate-binding protein
MWRVFREDRGMQRTTFFASLFAAVVSWCAAPLPLQAQTNVLRVTPQSNLQVLDPIWTSAFVTRNHGYMIWDTLFATDANGAVKPQMIDTWTVSADALTWTFVLRDGLAFHDGKPVTSADCIASIQRWSTRDTMGLRLAALTERWTEVDASTFKLQLREPYGLVLQSLGKQSSNVPFIMPKRVADTPGDKQISVEDQVGSGPYVFKRDEYKPGVRVVYVRNDRYRPRAERPSGLAGGKRVYVDRVEWVILKDPQTQFSALVKGEIDIIERPAYEHYDAFARERDIELVNTDPAGSQSLLRFNHRVPPFDDPRMRRAAMLALNQEAFMRTQVGSSRFEGRLLWRTCASMFLCGGPYASENAAIPTRYNEANVAEARRLVKDAGYDGKPIVVMRPTDLAPVAKLPLVAAQLLRNVGFNVDLQSMDWSSLLARRTKTDPVDRGGWNIFLTNVSSADAFDPIALSLLQATGLKGAWFGWPEDAKLEALRDDFARAPDDARRRAIAAAIQARAIEVGTHVPLGQFIIPAAVRKGVTGLVVAPAQVYWNIRKAAPKA